jgi:hypothetical protein
MDLGIEIQGAREVDLRFDEFPEAARANLFEAITRATSQLEDLVRQAVPKKTGKLAATIHSQVTQSSRRVTGSVNVTADFGKAGAIEYGSHRQITVKEHKLTSALTAHTDRLVSQYQRTTNIDPHEYLRGPLHQIESDALASMHDAVQGAIG